jgi:bifunctional non-homologous end joining protein LigD
MALPRIEPIITTRRREPFDHPDWLFDVKYDGFRALCFLEQWRGHFVSRNDKPLSRFTALAGELAEVLGVDEAILDGEVIVADTTGRPQFYDLLRGRPAPAYVAFDLLWIDGVDLRPKPLRERRAALRRLLPEGSPALAEAVSVEGRGCGLYKLMCAHDLEGDRSQALGRSVWPSDAVVEDQEPGLHAGGGPGRVVQQRAQLAADTLGRLTRAEP